MIPVLGRDKPTWLYRSFMPAWNGAATSKDTVWNGKNINTDNFLWKNILKPKLRDYFVKLFDL